MSTDTQELTKRENIDNNTIFNLITNGDCSRLTNDQKLQYYKARCDAAGLDARTKPFSFIKLSGKEVLYADKECSNQLASKHRVVCEVISQNTEAGIRTVIVRAKAADGRQTDEIGCVTVEGLKGDQLCNAYMKAVTKAKRRAILSLCGLGVLDESELETIPSNNTIITHEEKTRVDPSDDLSPKTIEARGCPSRFSNGKWKDVVIHFGKNKGSKLGELTLRQLAWYRDEWKPKPYNGVIDDATLDLREALDVYALERQLEKEAKENIQDEPIEEPDMADADVPF